MNKNLYKVKKKDSEKLSEILTECFSQDPLFCQLIPQKEIRTDILPEIFSCDIERLFENCSIYADSEEINGVIIISDETAPYNPVKYYFGQLFYVFRMMRLLISRDMTMGTL